LDVLGDYTRPCPDQPPQARVPRDVATLVSASVPREGSWITARHPDHSHAWGFESLEGPVICHGAGCDRGRSTPSLLSTAGRLRAETTNILICLNFARLSLGPRRRPAVPQRDRLSIIGLRSPFRLRFPGEHRRPDRHSRRCSGHRRDSRGLLARGLSRAAPRQLPQVAVS
jgi:hypothetical protein